MRRDYEARRPKDVETPLMKAAKQLSVELRRKLCQEKCFPKRTQWMYGKPMCDMLTAYRAALSDANKPKVEYDGQVFPEMRRRRYVMQQIALGKLDALDILLNEAVEVLCIDPDKMANVFGLIHQNYVYINAWIKADAKRYGPPNNGG